MKGVAVESIAAERFSRAVPVVLAISGRVPLASRAGLTAHMMTRELFDGSETGGDLVTVKVDWLVAMLALSLSDQAAAALWRGDRVDIGGYTVNYVPALECWIQGPDRTIRITDMQRWLPPDVQEAAAIFRTTVPPDVPPRWDWTESHYDDAVTMAERLAGWYGEVAESVRGALGRAGLPRYWNYGPGRTAGHVLDSITGKNPAVIAQPPNVLAGRVATAFVGGRISVFQVGHYDVISQADLNSAYPWAMMDLPSLEGALWVRWKWYDPSVPWGLWRVDWDVPKGACSGPFPVRTPTGGIVYPLAGSGWYWSSEVAAAIACFGAMVTPRDGFVIKPIDDTIRPFAGLSGLYDARQCLKNSDDTAAAHVLKLALTACYGRLAQSVQYNGKPGRWGNLALAGMVTAAVRAKMMLTLWEYETRAIAIATDSLTVDGSLDLPSSPGLGGWKVTQGDDAMMFPSGVFRVNGGAAAMERVSGVERARAAQIDWPLMYDGWRMLGLAMSYKVAVPTFHGLGMAGSGGRWDMFGHWRLFRHEIVGTPSLKPVKVAPRNWRMMPQPGKPLHARRYVPRAALIGRTDDQIHLVTSDVAREHDQPLT